MAVKVDKDNFIKEVFEENIPVLVDFWAPWCGPCKIVSSLIEEIAEEYRDKIKVCKLNVDEAPEIATKYTVMSIPTLMIFKEGKVMEKRVGVLSKDELIRFISSYIN